METTGRTWLAICVMLLLAPVLCDRSESGVDARHVVSSSYAGIVDFALGGNFELGFYTATVELGFPPREFKLLIDTGSDVSWVACASGKFSNMSSFYDPRLSSTAIPIDCTDQKCSLGDYAHCGLGGACSYDMTYVDGSFTSGVYVMDQLHVQLMTKGFTMLNITSPFVFGCATNTAKSMGRFLASADGILGLGRADISVISQLAYDRIAPRAFYHCLSGSQSGGGVLALGAAEHPDMVYTPLIPSGLHYNVHLRKIFVDGMPLPIHSGVFATTYFDSGTKLAKLAEEAYLPFMTAVTTAVSRYAHPHSLLEDHQCYSTSSSVGIDIFPHVRLEFEGGASILLAPQDYVLPTSPTDGSANWCLGIQQTSTPGLTILGELVMRNKVIVYDLTAHRIGWVYYNCSDQVNVSLNYTLSSSVMAARPRSLPLWGILVAALLHLGV